MTIYLVRHGSAGVRRNGDPTDTERHLDDVGLAQSQAVAALVTADEPDPAPITAVMSSPAARCSETVAPLAVTLGLEVVLEPRLFEGTSIDEAWSLVEGLAAAGRSAVLCSHGDVIPEVIHRARGRGMEVHGRSGSQKGSVWSLQWDGEHFASGTYRTTA